MTYLTALFTMLRREGPRLLVLVALIAITFGLQSLFQLTPAQGHPELAHLFSVLYLVSVSIGFAHLLCRVIFNRINLADLAKIAMGTPLGAALLFMSICSVLSVLLLCDAWLLH